MFRKCWRKSRHGQMKGTMAKWPVHKKLTHETHKTRNNDYLICIVYSSILLIKIIPPTNVQLQPGYGQLLTCVCTMTCLSQ